MINPYNESQQSPDEELENEMKEKEREEEREESKEINNNKQTISTNQDKVLLACPWRGPDYSFSSIA